MEIKIKQAVKAVTAIFFTVIAALITAVPLCAEEYESLESEAGAALEDTDLSDVKDGLSDLGITPSDPYSVKNLSPRSVLSYISSVLKEILARPIKLILSVMILSAISSVASSLSDKTGVYGEFFTVIAFIVVSPTAVNAFTETAETVRSCTAFMLSYIPVLGTIAAASGNIASAVSYNAVLMYFCELSAVTASAILSPVLSCILVLSAAQALSPDIDGLTASLKNIMTTIIGFIMTVFLGIIGIGSIFGRATEGLAVKAGKYAVSSFVPIIGYSLSESYRAVSLSLSAIRSAVGVFGIVVIFLFLLTPILTAIVYKVTFLLCSWLCRLTGSESLARLMSGISDTYSFLSTLLIFFAVMLIVATGMLILLGGTLLT